LNEDASSSKFFEAEQDIVLLYTSCGGATDTQVQAHNKTTGVIDVLSFLVGSGELSHGRT